MIRIYGIIPIYVLLHRWNKAKVDGCFAADALQLLADRDRSPTIAAVSACRSDSSDLGCVESHCTTAVPRQGVHCEEAVMLLCRGEIRNSVTRCAKGKLMS